MRNTPAPAPRVIVHNFRDGTRRVIVGIPTGDVDECGTDDESEILSDVLIFGTDGETYNGPAGFKDFYGSPTRNGPDHMGGGFVIDPRTDVFDVDPYVDHDPTGRVVDWFDYLTETTGREIAELREKLADAERNLSYIIAAASVHPAIGAEGIPSHLTPDPETSTARETIAAVLRERHPAYTDGEIAVMVDVALS